MKCLGKKRSFSNQLSSLASLKKQFLAMEHHLQDGTVLGEGDLTKPNAKIFQALQLRSDEEVVIFGERKSLPML